MLAFRTSVIVASTLVVVLAAADAGTPDPAGKPAFATTLRDINPRSATHGKDVALADLWREHGLALQFAASWCLPCREELPHLQELHAAGKGPIALVAADEGPAETANILILAERAGLTMPLLYVPPDRLAEIERHYTYQVLPSTYLIDPAGRVLLLFEGPVSNEELASGLARLAPPPSKPD